MNDQQTRIITLMESQNKLLENTCKELNKIVIIGTETLHTLNEQGNQLRDINNKVDNIVDNTQQSNNVLNRIEKRTKRCSIM